MALKIYHNPRCSKSRQTLKLIEEAGADFETVLYIDAPLDESEISDLLLKLRFEDPRQLMRKGEAIYKELKLKDESRESALIAAMASHPKLIERPIVVNGDQAILGRPPENVQKFL